MAELKNCPFCGGEAHLFHQSKRQPATAYVQCDAALCGTSKVGVGSTKAEREAEAIAAWNTRPAEPPKVEPVAVIGKDWRLLWASADTLAAIVERTGLQIGDKLYRSEPAKVAGEGEIEADALAREFMRENDISAHWDTAEIYTTFARWLAIRLPHKADERMREALEKIAGASVAFNAHPVGVIETMREWARAALGQGDGR